MSDKKNIEQLLSEMQEVKLPQGYDERFHARLEREEKPLGWFFDRFSILQASNVGWAATFASLFVVGWSIVKFTRKEEISDVAINDEIDMLDDLDVLENWNEEEV